MSLADTILIYTFTSISVIITVKGVKTAIIEIYRFVNWLIAKLKQTYFMIFPAKEPYKSTTTLGRWFERSKSTLIPFVSRDYYDQIKQKRWMGIGYIIGFVFGLFLIIGFFWALFQADYQVVLDNSPYLLQPIKDLLSKYRGFTLTLASLYIVGFIIEVINTIRSLF